MPRVSVILPNYNHAEYLQARIESILKQTYSDFELIFLDDASTDHSLEVFQQYQNHDKISQTIINTKNSGSTFIQWQKGIEKAVGEYIWIAESDDLAEPNFLEKLVSEIDKSSEIGLVYTPSTWINQKNETIHIPEHEAESGIWPSSLLIKKDFIKGNLIYNASSVLFRKKLISQVDFKIINSFKYVGDWLFWVQLIKNNKVSRIADRLNLFRRHSENVSTKAEEKGLIFLEGVTIIKYILDSYDFSFFEKLKVFAYWGNKIRQSPVVEKNDILQQMPLPIRFFYRIFKVLR
jgi:glycosyltransferase involved in cell wall biosynthesis